MKAINRNCDDGEFRLSKVAHVDSMCKTLLSINGTDIPLIENEYTNIPLPEVGDSVEISIPSGYLKIYVKGIDMDDADYIIKAGAFLWNGMANGFDGGMSAVAEWQLNPDRVSSSAWPAAMWFETYDRVRWLTSGSPEMKRIRMGAIFAIILEEPKEVEDIHLYFRTETDATEAEQSALEASLFGEHFVSREKDELVITSCSGLEDYNRFENRVYAALRWEPYRIKGETFEFPLNVPEGDGNIIVNRAAFGHLAYTYLDSEE